MTNFASINQAYVFGLSVDVGSNTPLSFTMSQQTLKLTSLKKDLMAG
jgi:hypothetical protein